MRRPVVIAGCLLVAALATWLHAAIAGNLAAIGAPWLIWPFATVGVVAAIAMRAYQQGAVPAWPALLGGALAIHLVAALALPLTSNDVWSNLAYGRLATAGANPYLVGPAALPVGDAVRVLVEGRWQDVPMVYGPLVGGACWLAAQAGSIVAELIAFKALMLACALAAIAVAAWICRTRWTGEEGRARFTAFAWCPLFAWEISGQAHNEGVLVLALVGFAACAEQPVAAILCLAAGIGAKFVAAPIAALYLVSVARSSLSRAIALGGLLVLACATLFAPWWHGMQTFSALWHHVSPELPKTSRSIADLVFWMASPFGHTAQQVATQSVSLIGVAVCGAIGVTGLVRTRTPAHVIHHALVLYLAADVIGLAWFQPWYVLWALPLALVHTDRRWLHLTATYAALSLVAYVLPIDPLLNVAIDVGIGTWMLALTLPRQASFAHPELVRE